MKQSYSGSCHCGAVKFQADIDPADGSFKCNCEICTKTGMWGTAVAPQAFCSLQGADSLNEYRPDNVFHTFCRVCGVKVYGRGRFPDGSEFYGISVAALDNPDDFVDAPISYFDGRHDRYDSAPPQTRHL